MRFLLDTNILIHALQKRGGETFHNFLYQLASRGHLFISVINRFELLAGTTERHRKKNLEFLDSFPSLPVTREIADSAGALFSQFRAKGKTVDNEDLLLSATAISEGLDVVTTNIRHFPSFRERETHNIPVPTRKGAFEIKMVAILTPRLSE